MLLNLLFQPAGVRAPGQALHGFLQLSGVRGDALESVAAA